ARGARARWCDRRALRRRHRLCRAARRLGGRRSHRDLRRAGRAHRAHPQGRGSHAFRARRHPRRAVGARAQAWALFDGRRARPERWLTIAKESDAMSERLLVLVRHGESEWNLKNLFTGWKDVDLTANGIAEARAAGRKLKAQGVHFDVAFTSALI